ncbi:hypothetical protein GFS31_29370 [Leptolyngbya sp. BL0902]|nr:hypothetical protein GFS31_29370 [Leptolyngbya sp. BL0902]
MGEPLTGTKATAQPCPQLQFSHRQGQSLQDSDPTPRLFSH